MFGKICSADIRKSVLPLTRAAKINSFCHRLKAAPRLTRAKTGILNIPIAIIAFIAPAPKSAVIRIAITKEGKANIKSFVRIITSSIREFFLAAAARPHGTPIEKPIPTAKSATANEVRAPIIIIDKISRPKWSVPSQ